MEKELKIGSVVKLNSSEPHEQKFSYGGQTGSGKAILYWYAGDEVKEALVAKECLEVID